MRTRNGKIARLPHEVREQLNQRLERAQPSPKLLDWLNAVPEVQEAIQEDFDGEPVSRQNLSQWRQGGFQEWQARRDLCDDARDVAQCAEKMDECKDRELADAAATVLAARFGSLIANWNGEVDAKFEAKTRVLNGLCRSVVQLQRGTHQANRESLEVDRLMKEKEEREHEELKQKLLRPFWISLGVPKAAKLFGGGATGEKLAQYFMSVQFGKLDAELDILPTDSDHEEPAPKEAESVKPTRKGRTAKRARKARAEKAAKPLEENEINGDEEAESTQDQAKPVTVCHSDLEQPEDEELGVGVGLRLGTDE